MSAIRPIRLFVLAALLAMSAACATETLGVTKTETTSAAKGNADNGKAIFMGGCSTCHGVTKEDNSAAMVGPSLFGVVGRKAGTVRSLLGPSENLKKHGVTVTWSTETLDEFLANPLAILLPDTAMAGILKDPQQRADVIAYLATLK